MATVISNNAVTVRGTGDTARGGMSRGSGHVEGTFTANTLKTFALAGGNTLVQTDLSIISNTTFSGADLTVSANAVFSGNVDFDITGANRLHLGGIDRLRLSGGQRGQFLVIEDTTGGAGPSSDTPQFRYLTLRDITDLSTNSAHIILSSANSSFSEDNDSPHIIFASGIGGSNPADKIHIFAAGDPATGGDSDLFVKMADSAGDSKFTIATVANAAVATISSTGEISTVNDLNVDGTSYLEVLDVNDTSRFVGTSTFHGTAVFNDEVTFNSLVKLYGDVEVGDAAADVLNVEASSYLNGNTTLGDANSDILYVNAEIRADLTPNTTNSFTLGKLDKKWKRAWIVEADFDNLTVRENSRMNNTSVTFLTANSTASLNDTTVTTLHANGNVTLGSALEVAGLTDLQGNVRLGNANTDTVRVTGEIETAIVPSANGQNDLGKAYKQWNFLYTKNANVATTLVVDGDTRINTLTATSIRANSAVDIRNDLNVDGGSTLNEVTTTTLTANGVTNLNSTLTVGGRTFLTRKLNVSEKTTLTDLHANGALDVVGSTALNGLTVTTLSANNTASLNDVTVTTLQANGTSTLNAVNAASIAVDGASALNEVTATTLTANGTSALNGATVTTLHANGNVTLGAALQVDGTSSLHGITGTTLLANGAVTFRSTLEVDDQAQFDGNVILGDNSTDKITVKGNFANQSTDGTSDFNGTVNTYGTLNVNGDSNIGDADTDTVTITATIDSDLIPTSNVTYDLGSSTKAWKDLYLSGSSLYLGSVKFADVSGGLVITDGSSTTVDITAATVNAEDLVVDGTSALHGTSTTTLHANGAITADSTLAVDGTSSLNGVTATSLHANGAITADSTLAVDGTSSLNGVTTTTLHANTSLNVDGTTTLNGTTVTTLAANLASTFANTVDVIGATTLTSITASSNAVFQDEIVGQGNTTLSYLTVNNLSSLSDTDITGQLTVSENVVVSGNLYVTGSVTTINTETIKLADNIIVLNSNLGASSPATQNAGFTVNRGSDGDKHVVWNETTDNWDIEDTKVTGDLTVTGDTSVGGNLDVIGGADHTIGNDYTGTNPNTGVDYTEAEKRALWQAGDIATLHVYANTVFYDKIEVAAPIVSSGPGKFSQLTITGTSELNDKVTILDDLDVSGRSTLADVHANGAFDVDGSSALHGLTATTIQANGTMTVVGSSYFNNIHATNIQANGSISINGAETTTLTASSTAELHAVTTTTLSANGTASLNDVTSTTLHANSDLTVDGDSALNGLTVTTLTANSTATLNDAEVVTLGVSGTSALNATTTTTLRANSAVTFNSTLGVAGTASLNGNATLGSDNSKDLAVNAKVSTNLIPKKTTGELGPNLGSSSDNWETVYANNAVIANELNVTGLIKSQSGILTAPENITAQYSQTTLDLLTSDSFHVTLTDNTELVLDNIADKIGGYGSIVLIQDSTGGWEVTWPSEFKTPRGATITQSTGASTMALLSYYIVDTDAIIVNYLGDFQ
jgi:hypothetical protein